MKEVKFRAWAYTKFLETPDFDVVPQMIYMESPSLFRFFDSLSHRENIELMQFTGLKDKNGKEIYESDIVRFKHNAISVIGGQTEVGEVKYYASELCFGFKTGKENYDWWSMNSDKFDLEVIGNIYESPELLEKTNA
jgi:uncharacterized phage protein (TIGR01671 family)